VATARRHVAKLEAAGIISVERPAKQGRGHHSRYQLHMPERVPDCNPSADERVSTVAPLPPERVSEGYHLGDTNPIPETTTTSSGCVDCGAAVTTDPATKQPNPRCKLCHASAKPGRAPAARRPVGPAYELYVADTPAGVVDAASTLSEARRALRCET
jgi:hypothetical protein